MVREPGLLAKGLFKDAGRILALDGQVKLPAFAALGRPIMPCQVVSQEHSHAAGQLALFALTHVRNFLRDVQPIQLIRS